MEDAFSSDDDCDCCWLSSCFGKHGTNEEKKKQQQLQQQQEQLLQQQQQLQQVQEQLQQLMQQQKQKEMEEKKGKKPVVEDGAKHDQPKKKDKGKEKCNEEKTGKKDDKPKEVTAKLKMSLHCNECIENIRREIESFEGVNGVIVDVRKEVVMVKGSMDVKAMESHLTQKLNTKVEVVVPKEGGCSGGKKQHGESYSCGGETKVDNCHYRGSSNYTSYSPYSYHGVSYAHHRCDENGNISYYPYAPELYGLDWFSDENANGCSIM